MNTFHSLPMARWFLRFLRSGGVPVRAFLPVAVVVFQVAAAAAETPASVSGTAWQLAPQAAVTGRGILLQDLVVAGGLVKVPSLLVAPAPPAGREVRLTRADILAAYQKQISSTNPPVFEGAEFTLVSRRSRMLEEDEVRERLIEALGKDKVRDRGELQLRFNRPWQPLLVPDEAFSLEVTDFPPQGLGSYSTLGFELRAGSEVLGKWQVPMQVKLLREVFVAGSALYRGIPLADADLVREKRDVFSLRDGLIALPPNTAAYEIAETLQPGAPILARSVRLRPLVRRGKIIEALVQSSGLAISVKVEALEDGTAGQIVRVRNIRSRREFRGKVKDEETVTINL